jgi:hypothetical protein
VFSSIPFGDAESYMKVEILKLANGGEEIFIGISKNYFCLKIKLRTPKKVV